MLTNKVIIKIIIVLLLLVCLLFYLFYKIKEPLTNNNHKQIIFLGDSILNNSNYVDSTETVLYQFQQLVNDSSINIVMKAEDDAKLYNFSKQYNFLLNDNKYFANSFKKRNEPISKIENYELFHSFLTMTNFRQLTGTQWLVTI